jgi:transposase-like protein
MRGVLAGKGRVNTKEKEKIRMFSIIDPMDFPVTPPMDRNFPVDANGVRLPEAEISQHPLRLRTNRSVGLFGTRRGRDGGLIRMHEGVDLLAPVGEPVFAVADGRVVRVTDVTDPENPDDPNSPRVHRYWNISIHHEPLEFGLVAIYIHTENPLVAVNESVRSGQRISEVARLVDLEPHLHFELRQLMNGTGSTLPLDPTRVLYEWEKKRFQNDAESRFAPDNPPQRRIVRLEEIVRDRMLRFLYVRLENVSDELYLPLYQASADELRLREMLMSAFFNNRNVRVVWRKSFFWGEVIDNRSDTSLMNVITEVRLYPEN